MLNRIDEFELSPEDRQSLEDYFSERDMIRKNFDEYISLKKQVVKTNCVNSIKNVKNTKRLDFNTTIGDTIKEKFESITLDLVSIGRQIDSANLFRTFWACGSPEITCVFETFNCFNPTGFEDWKGLSYSGTLPILDNIWHILRKNTPVKNEIYIGCNDECVKVILDNYIM